MKRQLATGLVLLLLGLPAQADMDTARAHFDARRWQAAADEAAPLARAGNAEAELLLGDLYGLGLLRDAPDRAAVFWQRAAFKGHPLAQIRLARAYRDGRGIPADRLRAALWFRLAAIGGAPFADADADRAESLLQPEKRAVLHEMIADLKPYLYPLAQ